MASEQPWPMGDMRPDAPLYALVTARLVARLQNVIDQRGLSLRAVAGPAGMDPTSLSRLLNGKVVPDLATIASLEDALSTDLWPGRLSRTGVSRE
jgi:transcriptional regulator with XRE-family HTH domain